MDFRLFSSTLFYIICCGICGFFRGFRRIYHRFLGFYRGDRGCWHRFRVLRRRKRYFFFIFTFISPTRRIVFLIIRLIIPTIFRHRQARGTIQLYNGIRIKQGILPALGIAVAIDHQILRAHIEGIAVGVGLLPLKYHLL